ncbi:MULTISPECIES: serine protease [unclassified Streptomyces]|uniref:S1 family peptidase n=1 Tax=unclassified Streptomyces TaxID=2593676 RepID=UPI0022561CC7|nr:serine protease [Streptomyces sp. NBC_00338]MCX5143156.1 serine protease [Streptomyces sp. NBC_00338]WSU61574.1 serine protease [Streptomyces sp. NBC_01104]
MGELRADWRLRLRRGGADGPVCGAGVLLTQDRALTCAHVLGEPGARMWVEFAESPGIPPVGARVAPDGWLPGLDGATGEDIAVLALDSPRPQAAPAPLARRLERGREVWIGGYAQAYDDGMWLSGRISGLHGDWVQIASGSEAEAVRPGFSGAAVQTRGELPGTEEVVGLVVSYRPGTDPAPPGGHGLAISYMIPVDRIAALVPLVAELSGPDGWDRGLERRLRQWFAGGEEPGVRFGVVARGSGRDRALQHQLHRAHLVCRGGSTRPEELVDTLVAQLRPPRYQRNAYRDWLLEGGRAPDRSDGGRPAGSGPVLAVIGLDEDPDPAALVPLLARVRTLGFRLLVIFRRSDGEGLTEVARQLLVPALQERADVLVRRVERIEREWTGLRGMVESASLVPRPAVEASVRRHRLHELSLLADPQDQLTELKQLLRELGDDLDRSHRSGQPDLPGQRGGPGPAERR